MEEEEEEEDKLSGTVLRHTEANGSEQKLRDPKPKARLYPPATHSLGFVHSL